MPKSNFDLLQLVEESAVANSSQAAQSQHALIGYMEPQLSRMYFGDFQKLKRILISITSAVMNLDSDLDICIRATNGNVYQDDSVGVVPIRLAVHYTFHEEPNLPPDLCRLIDEVGGTRLRYGVEKGKGSFLSFVVRLQASDNQLDRPLFIDQLKSIPMFVLSNEPPPNRAIHGNLRYWGLRCDGAPTFQEGILEITRQACLDNAYRIIIVSQPIEDGSATDVARELRSSSLSASTKLIHIDRFYSEASKIASLAAGFDGYIAKPFTTTQLLEILSEQLNVPLSDKARLITPSVLIVEDNLTNQKIAMFQLRRLGITADIAPDGAQALDALSRKQYSLILMDLQMPVMDGYEATTRIRQQPRYKDLPIIALTSNEDNHSRLKAEQAGMNGYCIKPFTQAQLEAVIARWCPQGLDYDRKSA